MTEPQINRMLRRSVLAIVAGLIFLAGAVAALVAHATTVGVVLLLLMLGCSAASFVFSVGFRNRAVASARQARREQTARLEARFKNVRPPDEP
jgi:hypothetical protein